MHKKKSKYMILLVVVSICAAGCALSTYNKADYIENMNMIDFGSYKVVLDKRFVPIGSLTGDTKVKTIDDTSADLEVTRHIFVDTSNGNNYIKKALTIYCTRIKDPLAEYRNVASFDYYKYRHIKKGRTKLNGNDVAYLVRSTKGVVAKDVLKLGESKGFEMSKDIKYGIEVSFATVMGIKRSMKISYFEGSDVNYDANYDEAMKATKRAKSYITLTK